MWVLLIFLFRSSFSALDIFDIGETYWPGQLWYGQMDGRSKREIREVLSLSRRSEKGVKEKRGNQSSQTVRIDWIVGLRETRNRASFSFYLTYCQISLRLWFSFRFIFVVVVVERLDGWTDKEGTKIEIVDCMTIVRRPNDTKIIESKKKGLSEPARSLVFGTKYTYAQPTKIHMYILYILKNLEI